MMKRLYAANYTPVGHSGGVARLKTHLNFFSPQALELFFDQIFKRIPLKANICKHSF
jgi:hypothetical protein